MAKPKTTTKPVKSKSSSSTTVNKSTPVDTVATTQETSTTATPPKKGGRGCMTCLIVLVVGFLITVALIVLLFIFAGDKVNAFAKTFIVKIVDIVSKQQPDVVVVDSDSDDDVESFLAIASPTSNAKVNGKISIEGTKSDDIEAITVTVYADGGEQLVSSTSLEDYDFDQYGNFSGVVYLTVAPKTKAGYIVIQEDAEYPTVTKQVPVIFDIEKVGELNGQNRLTISTPISNQLVSEEISSSILISGKMKDFFEGQVNFRIVDGKSKVLYEGFANATAENYNKFAPFSQSVNIADLEPTNEMDIYIVFYEVSAKDGSESEIMQIPLNLVVWNPL